MGFMDKAKKMAEQAQAKLDEAQKQFNAGQEGGAAPSGEPAVEYDVHGRPVAQAPPASASPPHGDPVAPTEGAPPPTAVPPVPPTPGVPPTGHGDPVMPPPASAEDRNHPSYAPPKLSDGDPLAG
jgi:formin 2/WAS/WASL-interacting protein